MNRLSGLAVVLMLAACSSHSVENGQVQCSASGNKCPDNFHCATDGTCWKNGSDPMPDMPSPTADLGPAAAGPHAATSVLSGGVTASSEHYKVIMSTGQSPGGNGTAASATSKKRGGLPGATQAK